MAATLFVCAPIIAFFLATQKSFGKKLSDFRYQRLIVLKGDLPPMRQEGRDGCAPNIGTPGFSRHVFDRDRSMTQPGSLIAASFRT